MSQCLRIEALLHLGQSHCKKGVTILVIIYKLYRKKVFKKVLEKVNLLCVCFNTFLWNFQFWVLFSEFTFLSTFLSDFSFFLVFFLFKFLLYFTFFSTLLSFLSIFLSKFTFWVTPFFLVLFGYFLKTFNQSEPIWV